MMSLMASATIWRILMKLVGFVSPFRLKNNTKFSYVNSTRLELTKFMSDVDAVRWIIGGTNAAIRAGIPQSVVKCQCDE